MCTAAVKPACEARRALSEVWEPKGHREACSDKRPTAWSKSPRALPAGATRSAASQGQNGPSFLWPALSLVARSMGRKVTGSKSLSWGGIGGEGIVRSPGQ